MLAAPIDFDDIRAFINEIDAAGDRQQIAYLRNNLALWALGLHDMSLRDLQMHIMALDFLLQLRDL